MTDELMGHVRATCAAMTIEAVRAMLRDLCDPSELTDAEIDAMDATEAAAYLAEITYDDSDPDGTRAHCALLAGM